MKPFIWNSRTGKTNPLWQRKSEVTWHGGRLTAREVWRYRNFGDDGKVTNLDCSGGYSGVRNSSNCIFYNRYVLLYGNYTLIKLIFLKKNLDINCSSRYSAPLHPTPGRAVYHCYIISSAPILNSPFQVRLMTRPLSAVRSLKTSSLLILLSTSYIYFLLDMLSHPSFFCHSPLTSLAFTR